MKNTGKYFDGQKSNYFNAEVITFSDKINIIYIDENGESQSIFWPLEGISKSEFVQTGQYLLQFGEFPQQMLQLNANDSFAIALQNKLEESESSLTKFSNKVTSGSFKAIITAILIFIAISTFLYFWALPKIAVGLASKMPQAYEIAIGDKMFNGMVGDDNKANTKADTNDMFYNSSKLEINQNRSKLVQEFANKINFKTNYPIKISVVKDSIVNAFALPGGHILVYEGLLNKIKSSEELAGLLAHEVAHVTNRHSLYGLSKTIASYLLISVITNDINGLAAILVEQGNQLQNLSHNRELEQEADLDGLTTLKRNKLEPLGMYRLMQTLEKSTPKGLDLPGFLSTHPLTKERMAYIKVNAGKVNFVKNEVLNEIWLKIKK